MSCPSDEIWSAFVDGDLGGFRTRRLGRHLDDCVHCTATVSSLRSLRDALGGAVSDGETPDAEAGWAQLASRLPPRAATPPARLRRFAPAFVLGLSAAAAGVVLFVHRRGPSDEQLLRQASQEFREAGEHYRRALDHLTTVTAGARASWTPAQQRAHSEAADALARATQACAEAARTRPDDPEAEELLFDAYRKQIAFLQEELQRGGHKP